jgi:hypothetical protein
MEHISDADDIFTEQKKNEVCSYFPCQNIAQNHDRRMGNKILHKCGRI